MRASKQHILKLLGLPQWQIDRICNRLKDQDAMQIIDRFRKEILPQGDLKLRINYEVKDRVWSAFVEAYPVLFPIDPERPSPAIIHAAFVNGKPLPV